MAHRNRSRAGTDDSVSLLPLPPNGNMYADVAKIYGHTDYVTPYAWPQTDLCQLGVWVGALFNVAKNSPIQCGVTQCWLDRAAAAMNHLAKYMESRLSSDVHCPFVPARQADMENLVRSAPSLRLEAWREWLGRSWTAAPHRRARVDAVRQRLPLEEARCARLVSDLIIKARSHTASSADLNTHLVIFLYDTIHLSHLLLSNVLMN